MCNLNMQNLRAILHSSSLLIIFLKIKFMVNLFSHKLLRQHGNVPFIDNFYAFIKVLIILLSTHIWQANANFNFPLCGIIVYHFRYASEARFSFPCWNSTKGLGKRININLKLSIHNNYFCSILEKMTLLFNEGGERGKKLLKKVIF